LTAFEKALFYWYEVHTFGREQQALSPAGSFARFKFEELLTSKAAQSAFSDVLGVSTSMDWQSASATRVDRVRRHTTERLDPSTAKRFPELTSLAAELGYDLEDVDQAELMARYLQGPLRQAADEIARMLRRRLPRAWVERPHVGNRRLHPLRSARRRRS
jgi:hypothetical protein